MSELNDFYYNENWSKVVEFVRKSRLETLNVTYIMSKIFSKLQEKNLIEDLNDILTIIAKYHINVMKDEMKEGIRILLNTLYAQLFINNLGISVRPSIFLTFFSKPTKKLMNIL